jgi:hypothetical protein
MSDDHPIDHQPTHRPTHHPYRWTLPRQRAFLEHLAYQGSVSSACASVGVSPRAAYALRYRADGSLFAVGWAAALLIARDRLLDAMLELSLDGVTLTTLRTDLGDGRIETQRRRHDHRLSLGVLARLDRMLSADDVADRALLLTARAVAQDFDGFLDQLSPPAVDPAHAQQAAKDAAKDATAHIAAQERVTAFLKRRVTYDSPVVELAKLAGIDCELAEKSVAPGAQQPYDLAGYLREEAHAKDVIDRVTLRLNEIEARKEREAAEAQLASAG